MFVHRIMCDSGIALMYAYEKMAPVSVARDFARYKLTFFMCAKNLFVGFRDINVSHIKTSKGFTFTLQFHISIT
jgi:hypothetical protein